MEKQDIKIKINRDGTITIDMEGFAGNGCLVLADELEKLLGDRIKRDLKPEVYDEGKDTEEILTTTT